MGTDACVRGDAISRCRRRLAANMLGILGIRFYFHRSRTHARARRRAFPVEDALVDVLESGSRQDINMADKKVRLMR